MLSNVPHLHDVTTTMELLGRMGVELTVDERMRIEVDAPHVDRFEAPYELVKTMRASILVLGPAGGALRRGRRLAARRLRHRRPAGQPARHGLEAMGAEIGVENGYIHARAGRLTAPTCH